MRTIVTIVLISLSVSFNAQSYIRVSNNPNAIADYTNLQAAIDNAPEGAIIYIEPSTTNYGGATITKRVVLLGGGYNTSKHDGKSSAVGTINLTKTTGGDPSGSLFSGINIGTLSAYNAGVDDITVQRCQSGLSIIGFGADTVENWKIINCRITNALYASRTKNILFANNFINSIYNTNDYSLFFINNIFYGYLSNTLSNLNFSNNIFRNGCSGAATNCSFNNNLFRETTYSLPDCDKNLCTNNIENVPDDNIFVAFSSDLHLKPSSPGIGAGSDGTDIGIYGGLYPFPEEDYGAIGFPQINSVNITNPVVEPNGTLKVNVKSKIIH